MSQLSVQAQSLEGVAPVALSKDGYAWVDIFDYQNGELFWKKKIGQLYNVGKKVCRPAHSGYFRVAVKKVDYPRHRVIWEMFNGPIPSGLFIDHINQVPGDDRIENLRLANQSQNNMNMRPRAKDGYKGMMRNSRGFYEVRITKDGKYYSLGNFKDPIIAAIVYDRHAIRLFGEFAATNFKYGGIVP